MYSFTIYKQQFSAWFVHGQEALCLWSIQDYTVQSCVLFLVQSKSDEIIGIMILQSIASTRINSHQIIVFIDHKQKDRKPIHPSAQKTILSNNYNKHFYFKTILPFTILNRNIFWQTFLTIRFINLTHKFAIHQTFQNETLLEMVYFDSIVGCEVWIRYGKRFIAQRLSTVNSVTCLLL